MVKDLMRQEQEDFFVVLDDAKAGVARYYQQWVKHDAIAADEIASIDALLQQGWQQGWHVVLWQPYDFGVQLMFGGGDCPMHLLWFERCDLVCEQDGLLPWQTLEDDASPCAVAHLENDVSQETYLQRIDDIHQAISRGEVYQINYTTQWHGVAYGSPLQLYRRLRQRQQVPYGVLAHLPKEVNAGANWHLGFSPELFLQLDEQGVMWTKPMKGTAPIVGDGQDQERAQALQNDAKNRAENVMIVDLLRNDLGRLACVGGVSVPQAFEVTAFGSVWQMTSTVKAQLRDKVSVAEILQATFPCGSITGAPKRMAMQVIGQLETQQRGLYTGSIGFLEPCDSALGFKGVWNVVIRSLNLKTQGNHTTQYQIDMGIGSGIVIDSVAEDEWQECGWKARFVKQLPADVGLIETMRVEYGQCQCLADHQQRMAHSAQALQLPVDTAVVWQEFEQLCEQKLQNGCFRVKCEITKEGHIHWQHAHLDELTGSIQVGISTLRLPKHDVLRRHKTNERALWDSVWQQALAQGCFDALVFNEDGHLLEGGRSNVFLDINGQIHTPSLQLDVLNGVMRRNIIRRPESHGFVGGVIERDDLTLQDVKQAKAIYLSNALRGLVKVTLRI